MNIIHCTFHDQKSLFQGWKTERVIMEDAFTMSRVILVEPADSKICWKKVVEVLAYVDRDLGLADTKLSDYEQKQVMANICLTLSISHALCIHFCL